MSAHTPGPWTVDSGETLNVRRPDGGILCQLHWLKKRGGTGGRVDGNENDANARLIAAAPELVEALRALKAAAEDYASSDPDMPSHGASGDRFERALSTAAAALKSAGIET